MEPSEVKRADEDTFLTVREAAEYLRLHPNTLATYRCVGKGPAYVKVSPKRILYRLSELKRYVVDVQPTGWGSAHPDVRAKRVGGH